MSLFLFSSPFWTGVRRVITTAKYLFRIVLVVLLLLLLWSAGKTVYRWWYPDTATITHVSPTSTTIEVPVEKIVTKTVTQYVRTEDRAMVNTLLAQNDALRAEVSRLTIAYASSTSTGTATRVSVASPDDRSDTPSEDTFPIEYQDWRLTATATSRDTLSYTLSQRFALAVTTGVRDDNTPITTAALYEIGPGELRTALPITNTQFIVASEPRRHFYRHLTLQGGIGKLSYPWEGVVALPWFKRGNTRAAEDTQWAFLTPAVSFTRNTATLTVLPVSANLGQLPGVRALVKDLWLSPMLTRSRRGVAFTVTF